MKCKKKLLAIAITITTLTISLAHAKNIYPAEIAGRDLAQPGVGWIGHVAVTTAYHISNDSSQVLEVLGEPIVGQLNTIKNFKSRSPFWGIKYGVANRGDGGQHVIVEANHQRWWCPSYTTSTAYTIGVGDVVWGTPIKCGVWRCDTYVWWAFYSAGYDTVGGRLIVPSIVFSAFPYTNKLMDNKKTDSLESTKVLDDVTAEELNEMLFEEFEMIADIPMQHETPQHIAAEWRLANDTHLNDIKRGLFIDRLSIGGKDPDTVAKLLKLYNETDSDAIKSKVIQGVMSYYQNHLNIKENTHDKFLIKSFYERLLNSNLNMQEASQVARGYIDLSTDFEILTNINSINKLMDVMHNQASVGIKLMLVRRSPALEKIYVKSIVSQLRKANDPDLDAFALTPFAMAYKNVGKNVLSEESRQEIIGYLNDIKLKYVSKSTLTDDDLRIRLASKAYHDLISYIGM